MIDIHLANMHACTEFVFILKSSSNIILVPYMHLNRLICTPTLCILTNLVNTHAQCTSDPDHIRARNNRLDFIRLVEEEKEGKSNETTRFKRDLTNTEHYIPKPLGPSNDNAEYRSYKRLCKGINIKVRKGHI